MNGDGEKKTYVLVQMMEILYNKQVYVFCSDDFKARQSIASLTKTINCISILGVLEEIYDGKFVLLRNGDLQYIK